MTLKPRRFWLPGLAMPLCGVLLWLEKVLDAHHWLNVLNEMLNLPAYVVFTQIAPGTSFYGFHTWFDRGLYLSLVGLCWYLVGVELDFRLLRKTASHWRIFRFCWIAMSVGIQGFVICIVWSFVAEVFRNKSGEPFDPIASAFFMLIGLSWLQSIALRLWKARPFNDPQRPKTSTPLPADCPS